MSLKTLLIQLLDSSMRSELTPVHLTHVHNLPSIVNNGILSWSVTRGLAEPVVDIARQDIRAARADILVKGSGGRMLTDFVPFYLAPRSPMLQALAHRAVSRSNEFGRRAKFAEGQGELVYVCVNWSTMRNSDSRWWVYDGHPTDPLSSCGTGDGAVAVVDREVLAARDFANTLDDGDRKRRRSAELLVADRVPFEQVLRIVVASESLRDYVMDILSVPVPVEVRPDWYFTERECLPPTSPLHENRCAVAEASHFGGTALGHALTVAHRFHEPSTLVFCRDILTIEVMLAVVAGWMGRPTLAFPPSLGPAVRSSQCCAVNCDELLANQNWSDAVAARHFAADSAAFLVEQLCIPFAGSPHALRLLADAIVSLNDKTASWQARLEQWINHGSAGLLRHRRVVGSEVSTWRQTISETLG